jgi:quercetin dioxygenase-like cupin family protein
VTDRPLISRPSDEPIAGDGPTFSVHEWQGSGPPQLHVHFKDDEAWHVLEGVIEFRFADGRRETAGPGTTVFVPAGVAHTYVTPDDTRYLIVLTPRLRALIDELHEVPPADHRAVYEKYDSEVLE